MSHSSRHRLAQLSIYALVAVALAWPLCGWAHVESGQAGGFLSGLAHPVSGLDHVLAMVAVGLWGAQLGMPAIWVLPVAFPMMMAFGGFLGLVGIPIPGVEIGIALSAVVLGALVLGQVRLPLPAAVSIVAVFAVFHGHAHGTELPAGLGPADGPLQRRLCAPQTARAQRQPAHVQRLHERDKTLSNFP